MKEVFVAVYTNKVKDYCEAAFFRTLQAIISSPEFCRGAVADNSYDQAYTLHLADVTTLPVTHIQVERGQYQFQRNVYESLKFLRDEFLKTDCNYFYINESDVIPPVNVLNRLLYFFKGIDKKYTPGIVGAQYYQGWHQNNTTLLKRPHVLSGCTLYSRKIIEKHPFRIDLKENDGAFPDAWICYDAKEFTFYDAPIFCTHLSHPGRIDRGQGLLNEI